MSAQSGTSRPVARALESSVVMRAPQPRGRGRWVLRGVVLAIALAASGVFVAQRGRTRPAAVDPATIVIVACKPLEVDVLETGRVQPREKVELKSRVAGQVHSVTVHEGDAVKKGDVLLILDPVDYQRDLAKAAADVAQARVALEFARINHERQARGFLQGLTSRVDLDRAAYEERNGAIVLRSADVARAVAEDRLHYTKIVSPMDGVVIARSIEPGEAVVPGVQSTFDGKSLLTVADLGVLLVKVNLNQIDAAKVAVGRKATLTLDALPGRTYEATVTKIAPASVRLAGKDQEVFPVEALLTAPDGAVRPGMTADVRIHLDAKPGALVLPLEAIVKDNGRAFVQRVVGVGAEQHTEKSEVTLGLRNDREVEVAGLAEGVGVVLRPPSAAENETKL